MSIKTININTFLLKCEHQSKLQADNDNSGTHEHRIQIIRTIADQMAGH